MFKTQNLYQNDEKWKNTKLGFSNETIGGWGCLLTSVTMMLNGIGYSETPESVNEKMKANGGFQGAFFIPSKLPYVFPNVIYKDMQPCESSPAPVPQIDAAVAAGKPVILQVDWNKQAGIQTHFVLVKEKQGDDYVLYDPYKYGGDGPDKEVLLTKRYKYNGGTLETEISAVLWFDAQGIPQQPPEQTKDPLPAEKFIVYVAEDDLALRADPSISGYLWKRLVADTELISLEPKATAEAKIGQQGQWLKVQDPEGQQGYVAAWYVSQEKGAPPADTSTVPATTTPATGTPASSSAPATTPPAGALALYPTDEVSFRTQPVISPDTLIRHLPPTEQIISLESADQTIAKIGVEGQWLNVQDSGGQKGFVAAWYVRYAGGSSAATPAEPAPAETPATDPATPQPASAEPIKVKTTVEGIAFRKEPLFSGRTVIRRLPLGTELSLVEPGDESKIGSNDQWLKVKDASGTEGYISAWFVTR